LLEHNVEGGFPSEVHRELSRNNRLTFEIVQNLLSANFPETLHPDILDAVGIEFSACQPFVAPRSPDFRERVLLAYEHSCTV
jgi:putative restriction endonuclease